MSIDWSKAPEGATHFNKTGGANHRLYSWMRILDGVWFFYRGGIWERQCDNFPDKHDQLVERPIARYCEGLPPIGEVCILSGHTERLTVTHPEWAGREVKIYAHFETDRGNKLAAYVSEDHMLGGVGTADLFIPIRTPEQIEAERLKSAIDDMVNVGACGSGITIAQVRIVSELLAKAGYRKFEIVDKDDGEGEV